MGCGSGILKCILILINITFALIGLLLLGIGIYLEYFANDTLNDLFADVISEVPGLSDLTNVVDGASNSGDASIDFASLLSPISIALIVIGAVISVIALSGLFGACCNSKCLLIIYCILVAIILVAQIVLVGLFFGGVMECCGINDYTDFYSSTSWHRERSATVSGVTADINMTTPIACCKFDGDFPSVTVVEDTCATAPSDSNSNWKTGCWDACQDRLTTYQTIAIGVLCGIIVIQFIILLAAICVVKSFDKDDD